MKKINSRFGEIEYDPSLAIHFPEGLIGFEHLRSFLVMPSRKEGPLFWIQSVEVPDIAFIVTDPSNFFLDYKVIAEKEELKKLGINSPEDCHTLSIVTVTTEKKVTLNLSAPIIFSEKTNKALQVILENPEYSTKTPLPEIEK